VKADDAHGQQGSERNEPLEAVVVRGKRNKAIGRVLVEKCEEGWLVRMGRMVRTFI
jgi:hypothetical protein